MDKAPANAGADILDFRLPTSSVNATVNRSALKRVGVGGLAEVYKYADQAGRSYAFKLYRQPQQADWGRIAHLVDRYSAQAVSSTGSGIAWPIAKIEAGGKPLGIALPFVGDEGDISLDWWVERPLIAKLPKFKDALSSRLLLLKNLAGVLADLHASGIAVVDLKPSNIIVRNNLSVVLLDADSFGVREAAGRFYKPTHVSASYIAPEAYSAGLDVGALWDEQDRYAFAVIAFQVLNFGVHPYQCRLTHDAPDGADTNDDKAKLGLYAYGLSPHPKALPVQASVHASWSAELRLLFDCALTKPKARPLMSEWRDALGDILESKSLSRCAAHPDDPTHIRFEGLPCSRCARDKANETLKATSDKLRAPRSSPWDAGTAAQTVTATTAAPTSNGGWLKAVGAVGAVILGLAFIGNLDKGSSRPPPPPANWSPPPPSGAGLLPPVQPAPAFQAPPAVQAPPPADQPGVANRLEAELRLTNADWMRIQTALAAATGQQLQVDGVAGPNTRATIQQFQRSVRISDHGTLDLVTLRQLRRIQSSRLGYQVDLELPLTERTQQLDNGEYRGGFVGNLREGVGTYRFSSGIVHVGEWRDGRPEGFGRRTWPNGFTYSGQWERGLPNGPGTLTYSNGQRETGYFVEGCMRPGVFAVRAC
jgi:serine/threonine protein kinase